MSCDEETLHRLLKKHFGWDKFRSVQLNAIQAVLSGKNVFVRSATGSGKSLIWQLAAVARVHMTGQRKLTVVVYPTKALLLDQAEKLANCAKTLRVVCLHGDQTPKERHETLNRVELTCKKPPDILLTVPEYMVPMNPDHAFRPLSPLLERLQMKNKLALIVIDEAQQILQWGESFRAAYLDFANVISEIFPKTPRLALSAAITDQNVHKTIEKLNMKDHVLLSTSLDHPQTYHEVRMKQGKHICVYGEDIKDLLRKGQGIIYCTTRNDAAELTLGLLQKGIPADCYHGGLDAAIRSSAVKKWLNGDVSILVATVAFMFGIDNPNVRWVVWNSLPSSVENWVQGSGRAGRDGRKAWSIVCKSSHSSFLHLPKDKHIIISDYKPTDIDIIENLKSEDSHFELESIKKVTSILHDTLSCRRSNILSHFGESRKERCNNCDTCLSPDRHAPDRVTQRNLIEGAQDIVKLLQSMAKWSKKEWIETRAVLIDAILGKKNSKFAKFPAKWDDGLFGCQIILPHGPMTKEEITILVSELIKIGVLEKKQISSSVRWRKHPYLKLGPKAEALLNGTLNTPIRFPVKTMKAKSKTTSETKINTKQVQDQKKKLKSARFSRVVRDVVNGKEVDCIVID